MTLVSSLTSFSAGTTMRSADVNANFTAIRTVVNTSVVHTDVAATVSAAHTFSAGFSVSAGQKVAVGIAVASAVAPVHVGDSTTNNSLDCQVLVSRAVDDDTAGNGHAFSDSSTVTRSGGVAYNSFDARIVVSGSNSYDHYAGFQAAPVLGTSGTTTHYYAFVSIPEVTAGTVTNVYGLYAGDTSGAGTVTNQYGVYVAAQTKGTTKYAVYTAGTAPSQFGGDVTVSGVFNVTGSAGLAVGSVTGRRRIATTGAETFEFIGDSNGYARLNLLDAYTNNGILARSMVAYTNGAGAATGTLTNAPSAGNPTKWLRIDDNGTTRYIPAW